jgi:sugar lactone lactonase YvrE
VVAPTGLGLGRHGQLYVADTGKNRITLITHAITRTSSAGTGTVVTSGRFLDAPLGLAVAGDGDVLTVNGGNGRIVETAPDGRPVSSEFLDRSGSPPGDGALFGLAIAPHDAGVYYVDDAVNTLRLLH